MKRLSLPPLRLPLGVGRLLLPKYLYGLLPVEGKLIIVAGFLLAACLAALRCRLGLCLVLSSTAVTVPRFKWLLTFWWRSTTDDDCSSCNLAECTSRTTRARPRPGNYCVACLGSDLIGCLTSVLVGSPCF